MRRAGEVLIDDNDLSGADPGDCSRGLIPRDYQSFPVGYSPHCPAMRAVNIPLIPRSEWSDRIKQKIADKSQLSDIRLTGDAGNPIASLDQGSVGYCWAHSSTQGVHIARAVASEPHIPLSAYAVAATIKNGRDEGAWGALSMEFIQSRGVPAQSFWPQGSRDLSHGTKECWDNGARHKVTAGWIDLDAAVYDRDLTFDQVGTLLLSDIPVVGDFNWWSHSVLLLDLVETSSGQFGVRILNSWGDSWSDRGMGVLSGRKAIPDGAVAPRVTMASGAA